MAAATTRLGTMLLLLALALSSSGCGLLYGAVNPSPELRWWLFSHYGAGRICPEMLNRGLSLRLRPAHPAIGRFFPNRCRIQVHQVRRTVTVDFGGTGYGYAPVSGRVAFRVDTAVEYRMDFRMTSKGSYVWGIFQRAVRPPRFQVISVENLLAGAAQAPLGGVSGFFGQQIVQGELTRGFTVLHRDRGNSFALGIVRPPGRPFSPFHIHANNDVYTYANETIQVAPGQRDYLGPFEVTDSDQDLTMQMVLRGVPVDVMVVGRRTGNVWRQAYESNRVGPPPGPILAGGPLQPGLPFKARYRLPRGSYYVVIDNTIAAGRVSPRFAGLATMSYVAQLVER